MGKLYSPGGTLVVLADKEARLPFVLRKTSARRGLGVKKVVFCGLHSKGIKVGKCGVWEAHHNKGIRNGQERPGTRVKEIEFEREIPAFQKPERPRCVLVASTLSQRDAKGATAADCGLVRTIVLVLRSFWDPFRSRLPTNIPRFRKSHRVSRVTYIPEG